ncbi:periplasmic heavy metal sensor [Prolixibacteraceae bacterium JC049]|nr:periplasmic heavy metal sensor [Prolixibacteraceae bacterium JC049]
MKTRFAFLILMVFAVITAGAQPRGKKHNAMKGQRVKQHERHMMMKLNLSDEQKESMKAIRLEAYKESKPLRDQLRELKAKQQTLTTAEKADMKSIDKNIDAMSKVQNKLAKLRARNHQKIRSLLTEEQRIKFDERKGHMAKRYIAKHKKMRGNKRS